MARKLAFGLLFAVSICWGAAAKPPQVPVEVPVVAPQNYQRNGFEKLCPGCDCEEGQCFSPVCDCRLPTTQAWGEKMLAHLRARLEAAFPGKDGGLSLQLKKPLRVTMTDPRYLMKFGLDEVQGYYGDGQIRVSSELSRRDAATVLAHEFGHAWHHANNPQWNQVHSFLAEGFAEWVAYQALRCYGDGGTAYKIRSSGDEVYGGGLRYFLDLERQGGSKLVFEVATTWIDLRGTRVSAPSVQRGPRLRPSSDLPPPEPTPRPEY